MVARDFFGHPLFVGDLVVYVGGWGKVELISGTIVRICKKQILISKSGSARSRAYKYPNNVIRNKVYENEL